MVDTNEEDVSIRDIKRMLRAAENRLRNLNRGDALEVVRRAVFSCKNPLNCLRFAEMQALHDAVNPLKALIGDRADRIESFYKQRNEWEGREAAIALLLDITDALKKPLIFEHGFDGTSIVFEKSRGCIFPTMPQVISDIVTIHGILNYYLPGTESMTLEHRLVHLGMPLFNSSPWVLEAANEAFVALAEMTLDKIELSDNRIFEEMAAYIIEVAKNGVLFGRFDRIPNPKFQDRVEAIVDEIRGVRELSQQEAGITPINPLPEKGPASDHRKIRLLVDAELPTGTRTAIHEGFRRAIEGRNERSVDLLKILREKGELSVDAPAFEKRPVPKPETLNGETPKPIKR